MSKKKKVKGPRPLRASTKDNKALIKVGVIVALLLCVLVSFGAYVSRKAEFAAAGRTATAPLPTPEYAANAPAREYFYAGSKLLAVSEPAKPVPNDLAVWRVSTGTWYIMGEATISSQTFGQTGDIPSPGDFDGDGKTDFCVFRPSTQTWYILETGTSSYYTVQFGQTTDVPVQADFDGDGRPNIAVYSPSTASWFVKNQETWNYWSAQFGTSGDKPIPSDFDGDGKADMAVWRNSNATFYSSPSNSGGIATQQLGSTGDLPVLGDYDGDSKTDHAVWKPGGTWSIRQSSTGNTINQPSWGYPTSDIAVQGDYDADGKTDRAVWRPSNGTWYILKSSNGNWRVQAWGENGDIPVPAPYRR